MVRRDVAKVHCDIEMVRGEIALEEVYIEGVRCDVVSLLKGADVCRLCRHPLLQHRPHLLHPQADPRFERSQGQVEPAGHLLVGETAEVGQLDGLTLLGGDALQSLVEGEAQVSAAGEDRRGPALVQLFGRAVFPGVAPEVDDLVAGQGVEPGGDAAAVRPVGAGAGPDGGEDLLDDILGEGAVTAKPVGVGGYAGCVTLIKGMEGREVAAGGSCQKVFVAGLGRVSVGSFLSPPLVRGLRSGRREEGL